MLHSQSVRACTLALAMLSIVSAHGDLLFYQSFDDAPGTFPPEGWTSTETGIASVTEGALTYPNLFTSGNKLEFTAVTGKLNVSLTDTPPGSGETVYYSFLMQVHNVGTMGDGATSAPIALRATGGAQHEGVAGIGFGRLEGDSEDQYRLSVVGGFRGFGRPDEATRINQTFDEGETLFIVASYNTVGESRFWINPNPSTFGLDNEPAADYVLAAPTNRAVSELHIIDGSRHRFQNWSFDELRYGTTWADVTPVEEPKIVRTETGPTIDGAKESLWLQSTRRAIAKVTNGKRPDHTADLSASWFGLYDNENFYLAVDIIDEVLTGDSSPEDWMNDRIEVYFNMDNAQPAGNARTGDNYQYVFPWTGAAAVSGSGSLQGVTWQKVETDNGWFVEIAFPWEALFLNTPAGEAEEGYRFGFDIAIVDNDGRTSYDSIVFWNSETGGLWGNMDTAGVISLGPDFDGNYPPVFDTLDAIQIAEEGVESEILLTATDLNEDATLEFSGKDLPPFVTLSSSGAETVTLTINAKDGDAGLYTFEIVVSDGSHIASSPVFLVVKQAGATDQAPAFSEVEPTTVSQEGVVSVTLRASDPDSFSIIMRLADGAPAWASLVDNGDKSATLTLAPGSDVAPGDYTVTVEAVDYGGLTGSIEVAVEVKKLIGTENWWEHYAPGATESAETGPFLGTIWVELSPWFYQSQSESWLYIDGTLVDFGIGAWIFSPALTMGPGTNAFPYWKGYTRTNGWAWTGLGWLYAEGDYAFCDAFNAWFYASEFGTEGTWIYVLDFNDITPPTPPVRVEAAPVNDSRIDVTWRAATDNIGVKGYQVFRDGSLVGTTEKTMVFSDTGLNPQTSYTYTVRAYDAAGHVSEHSDEASAQTHESRAEVDASWQEAWDSWDEETIEAWYLNNTGPGALGINEDEMWNPTTVGLTITQAWLEEHEGNGNVYRKDGRWVVEGVKAGWFIISAHPVTLRGCLALLPSSVPEAGIARPSSQQQTGGPTIIIEYCHVKSAEGVTPNVKGIEGANLIVRNCRVGPGQDAGSGYRMWNYSHLEYSWVFGLTGHHSGIALRGSHVVARRNYTEIGTSASLFIYAHDSGPPADGLNDVLVEENYINSPISYYGMNPGGARNALAQSATNVRVVLNRWGEKNFWPDDSHDIGGSHRTWLGDIPAGDWVDSRGNIWGGNHWIATGNYISPKTGQYAWDHPDHTYNDPWVAAHKPKE